MKTNGIIFIVLGSIVAIFGPVGFFLKGSIPSLISGLFFGPLLIFSGKKTIGKIISFETIGLITTFILDLFFSYRLLKTKLLFPSGIMALICTLVIAIVCANIKKRISTIPTD